MNNKYYAMKRIEKKAQVSLINHIQDLELSWYEGMVGVLPVFDDEDKAKNICGDNGYIELEVLS